MRIVWIAMGLLVFENAHANPPQCVSAIQSSQYATLRGKLFAEYQKSCYPIQAAALSGAVPCDRVESDISESACSPLCKTSPKGAGSGKFFRIGSENGGACLLDRRKQRLNDSAMMNQAQSSFDRRVQAYMDLTLDSYRAPGSIKEGLIAFVSRLERFVRVPEIEGIKVGSRPLREAVGEILLSYRNLTDEMSGLAGENGVSDDRVNRAQMHLGLLLHGCRSPLNRDLDKCDDGFRMFSIDELETSLQSLEKKFDSNSIVGKAVFGLKKARLALRDSAHEMTFALNEMQMVLQCRKLSERIHANFIQGALPICGIAAHCPDPVSPSSVIGKPVQAAVIEIPPVVISGKFSDRPNPQPSKLKPDPTAELNKVLLKDAKRETQDTLEESQGDEEVSPHHPKTGDPTLDEAQKAIDDTNEALKYRL